MRYGGSSQEGFPLTHETARSDHHELLKSLGQRALQSHRAGKPIEKPQSQLNDDGVALRCQGSSQDSGNHACGGYVRPEGIDCMQAKGRDPAALGKTSRASRRVQSIAKAKKNAVSKERNCVPCGLRAGCTSRKNEILSDLRKRSA